MFRDVMRLKYGWVLAWPALICSALFALGVVLLAVHLALVKASDKDTGIELVEKIITLPQFGDITLYVVIAVFILWLLIFIFAGTKGDLNGNDN